MARKPGRDCEWGFALELRRVCVWVVPGGKVLVALGDASGWMRGWVVDMLLVADTRSCIDTGRSPWFADYTGFNLNQVQVLVESILLPCHKLIRLM